MKHFIGFIKKKGLFIAKGDDTNHDLVDQINHELMKVGYVMTHDLHEVLSTQTKDTLNEVYNDLISGIRKVVGDSGYEPIYKNFPQSVLELSYSEFLINAIMHYWTFGSWRPEDSEYINREFKLEAINYKPVGLLSEDEFNSIFSNIAYSGTSISSFDKEALDYYINNGGVFDLSKISFKETLAYVGKRLMDSENTVVLGTKNATDVLRLWAAYSGGDEGLKANTKFLKPSNKQSEVLRNTLEACYNLEDSFKTYREPWLRVLFYLNPMTKRNRAKFPTLYSYTLALRNDPKSLETFNSKVERLIKEKDQGIFGLLKNRQGVFTRRLDHLVRVFGIVAIEKYIEASPSFINLVTTYNHFSKRDQVESGRGAILADQSKSSVVTYDALEPLDAELVATIKSKVLTAISTHKSKDLEGKKTYIDRSMYYTPLAMNNRASSLALDSKVNGTVVPYTGKNTIRMYVHWHGTSDIDLSGMVIANDNGVSKIGWNGKHVLTDSIVYSGDNTGYSQTNAEYMDINVDKLPSNTEWILINAYIYRGPNSFKGYKGKCFAGFMEVDYPTANSHWQPENLNNAIVLNNGARNAYLMAFHVPSKNLVYLDMELGSASNVATAEDALKMRMFLEKIATIDDGGEVKWDRLNQGHLLQLLSSEISPKEEADLIFDETTKLEEVSRILSNV